jgi:hypothetical protein
MEIGTAVPNKEELSLAKHHFIQHKSIFESYSVGDFERDALQLLEKLFEEKDTVIMVGGSGLYIDAVIRGLDDFPKIDSDIRKQLNERLHKEGIGKLQEELKKEYDSKSRWGKNYDEYYELFEIDVNFNYDDSKQKLEDFKKNNINNIQIIIDDKFDGSLEYERYVKCKECDGSGKDLKAKILIRDTDGNIFKIFDPDDGCDFCNGPGESYDGTPCSFCNGQGKIGMSNCKVCDGEKRILGKQKLVNIKLTGEKTKLDAMGHYAKDGKIGYLLLVIKKNQIQ